MTWYSPNICLSTNRLFIQRLTDTYILFALCTHSLIHWFFFTMFHDHFLTQTYKENPIVTQSGIHVIDDDSGLLKWNSTTEFLWSFTLLSWDVQ